MEISTFKCGLGGGGGVEGEWYHAKRHRCMYGAESI